MLTASMTDCTANELVVKAQVEIEHTHPAPDQQVAVADQPMAIQAAPNAPNTGADQRARAEHYREPNGSSEPVHDRAQPPTCSKCTYYQLSACCEAACTVGGDST